MLPASGFVELLLWVLRLRRRLRVVGASMLPALSAGDEVLVNFGAFRHTLPQVEDVVVACRPDHFGVMIVKRVMAGPERGRLLSVVEAAVTTSIASQPIPSHSGYILLGDNLTASTDSREFGPVPAACILGKVTSKFG